MLDLTVNRHVARHPAPQPVQGQQALGAHGVEQRPQAGGDGAGGQPVDPLVEVPHHLRDEAPRHPLQEHPKLPVRGVAHAAAHLLVERGSLLVGEALQPLLLVEQRVVDHGLEVALGLAPGALHVVLRHPLHHVDLNPFPVSRLHPDGTSGRSGRYGSACGSLVDLILWRRKMIERGRRTLGRKQGCESGGGWGRMPFDGEVCPVVGRAGDQRRDREDIQFSTTPVEATRCGISDSS